MSGKSPNTDTGSADGDLAGGGVSQTDFGCGVLEETARRGDMARVLFGDVGVRDAAADEVPPFVLGRTGGGRVCALMAISSSFGNAIPAALPPF